MVEINEIFEERKNEIEFYYSVLVELDKDNKDVINTFNNPLLFRIMKSNFILMLYNMVEATVITGMLEIFAQIKEDNCNYSTVISEIKDIWRDYEVKKVYGQTSSLKSYTERVKRIVEDITNETPIVFAREILAINGNLNAKRITALCDEYRIQYRASDKKAFLEQVRQKRNSLSHGDESFSNCSRDLTISDLEEIKDTIIGFLTGIIKGMTNYCDNRLYLIDNNP
ncbi:MAG: hypothetical protein IK104_07585 [Clostridia bacterium]|nr:hypothetical protein [Clostridia bacterium]